MSKPPSDAPPFAKIVVIFAASFAIGLGLCGLNFFLASHSAGGGNEEFGGVIPLGLFSLVILVISFLGLVVSLLVWAVAGILRDDT